MGIAPWLAELAALFVARFGHELAELVDDLAAELVELVDG